MLSVDYGSTAYYPDGTNWLTVPIVPASARQTGHNSGGALNLAKENSDSPEFWMVKVLG